MVRLLLHGAYGEANLNNNGCLVFYPYSFFEEKVSVEGGNDKNYRGEISSKFSAR